jgi:hypothetical protein
MFEFIKQLTSLNLKGKPVTRHCPRCKREVCSSEPSVESFKVMGEVTYSHACPREAMRRVILTTKSRRDAYDDLF